jgi:hypothetical protein
MIDFLLPVLVGIVLGVMILQVINIYRAWRELNDTDNELSAELDEFVDKLEKQKLIVLDIEAVDGQFMCYNSLTKEFVCMGQNMTEVQERFRQRYPNKEAAMIKEDSVAQQLKATV